MSLVWTLSELTLELGLDGNIIFINLFNFFGSYKCCFKTSSGRCQDGTNSRQKEGEYVEIVHILLWGEVTRRQWGSKEEMDRQDREWQENSWWEDNPTELVGQKWTTPYSWKKRPKIKMKKIYINTFILWFSL